MIFSPSKRTRQNDIYINNCNFLSAPANHSSAIDIFLTEKNHLLGLTNPANIPTDQSTIFGLVFLGIISAVENYFRKTISDILSIDPNSRLKAQNETISFGSIDWYSAEEIGNAFVDDGSLASGSNIREIIKRLTGFELEKEATIKHDLAQFDSICQIRHCLIHANGHIRAINAKRLGIDKTCVGGRIQLTLPFLHDTIALCEHMIRETNLYMFQKIMIRLFKDGQEKFSQNYSTDKQIFKKVLNIFLCRNDRQINERQYYSIYAKFIKTLFR